MLIVPLSELRTRCLEAAGFTESDVSDVRGEAFISTDELDELINESKSELHDLIKKSRSDMIASTIVLNVSQSINQIPDDCLTVRGLFKVIGDDEQRLVERTYEDKVDTLGTISSPFTSTTNLPVWIKRGDQIVFKPTSLASTLGDIRFDYIPTSSILSGSTDTLGYPYTTDMWHTLIHCAVGAKLLDKEQSDSRHLIERKLRIEQRISSAVSDGGSDTGYRVTRSQSRRRRARLGGQF